MVTCLRSRMPPVLRYSVGPDGVVVAPGRSVYIVSFGASLIFSGNMLTVNTAPNCTTPRRCAHPKTSPSAVRAIPLRRAVPLQKCGSTFTCRGIESGGNPSNENIDGSIATTRTAGTNNCNAVDGEASICNVNTALCCTVAKRRPNRSLGSIQPVADCGLGFDHDFLLVVTETVGGERRRHFYSTRRVLQTLRSVRTVSKHCGGIIRSRQIITTISLILTMSKALTVLFNMRQVNIRQCTTCSTLIQGNQATTSRVHFSRTRRSLRRTVTVCSSRLRTCIRRTILLCQRKGCRRYVSTIRAARSHRLGCCDERDITGLCGITTRTCCRLRDCRSTTAVCRGTVKCSPSVLDCCRNRTATLVRLNSCSNTSRILTRVTGTIPSTRRDNTCRIIRDRLLEGRKSLPSTLSTTHGTVNSTSNGSRLTHTCHLTTSVYRSVKSSVLSRRVGLLGRNVRRLPSKCCGTLTKRLTSTCVHRTRTAKGPNCRGSTLQACRRLRGGKGAALRIQLGVTVLRCRLRSFSGTVRVLRTLGGSCPGSCQICG